MTDRPKLTWKGRLIAFSVSAVLCVALLEGLSRVFDRTDNVVTKMQLIMHPYMMFVGYAGTNATWRNIETKTDIPSTVHFNNLGFTTDSDFAVPPTKEFLKKYARSTEERLVVITGGSVVHGVGATANDKTIAGQLEVVLNERQSKYRYRVLNLGMGSWIAYQQFISLSLFALPLKPEWVVVMDGHNDAAVACPHGSGAGNPMSWPQMLYLTGGGEGIIRKSPLVQWLIQNSATARVVTGLQPTGQNSQLSRLYFDDTDPDKRFVIKLRDLKFSELDKQVEFYLLAQQNVKELFSSANIIYGSQPYLFDSAVSPSYRKAFDLQGTQDSIAMGRDAMKADLDNHMAKASEATCNDKVAPQALGYFMGRAALRLGQAASEWAAEAKGSRSITYVNPEMLFPGDYTHRVVNFIDNAHMSDSGQRRLAEYFAGYILKTDVNAPFNPAELAAAVHAEAIKLSEQPSRKSP